MELFGDGTFIYNETYGKNVLVSAAILKGSYEKRGENISFYCKSFEANKASTRFKAGNTYTAKCNADGELAQLNFITSGKNKNFFGAYADDLWEALSNVTGEVSFLPVTENGLPESALEILDHCKLQFHITL